MICQCGHEQKLHYQSLPMDPADGFCMVGLDYIGGAQKQRCQCNKFVPAKEGATPVLGAHTPVRRGSSLWCWCCMEDAPCKDLLRDTLSKIAKMPVAPSEANGAVRLMKKLAEKALEWQ